ncbi:MAG: bifunctional ornithine acetyltransferase/N-acetylglutamate synthase [Clostridiales bacterium]|nr:bifunctional ornithine acetyltransferase/N-acetylglutamate synthase [Clostridiales bacterium]
MIPVAGSITAPKGFAATGVACGLKKDNRLDLAAIHRGVQEACASLASSEEAGHRAEQAIMTTDLVPKECVVSFELEGKTITVAGMAKGSGMIAPNMATMLAICSPTRMSIRPCCSAVCHRQRP